MRSILSARLCQDWKTSIGVTRQHVRITRQHVELQDNMSELQDNMSKLQDNMFELQDKMSELQGNMLELQGNMSKLSGKVGCQMTGLAEHIRSIDENFSHGGRGVADQGTVRKLGRGESQSVTAKAQDSHMDRAAHADFVNNFLLSDQKELKDYG